MVAFRLLRILSATVVAAFAAFSSYWHMVHVALRYGERSEVTYVLPLSVDGVLTLAAIVMSEDRRHRQPVRCIAKVAFLIGLSASIAANVAAAQPTVGGRLIAAWPAVALFLVVEMMVFVRPRSDSASDPAESATDNDGTREHFAPSSSRAAPTADVPGKFRVESASISALPTRNASATGPTGRTTPPFTHRKSS